MPVKRHRGFTFVDIIFIVAILGATVALLYPVVEAAKENGRSTKCLNNLKQCAQAVRMYADDYDGTMPSSGVVAPSPTQPQVIKFLTGIGHLPHNYGTPAETWSEFLYDHMRSPDIIRCPSDRPRSRASYWYKYANDLAWRTSGLLRRKISDYGYDAQQIAFYEHAGWHSGDAAGVKNGVKINVSFVDTHVATITVVDGPTSSPPASDERTGASAIRLGLPMYYNCSVDTNGQSTEHSPGDFIDPRTCYDKL